MNALTIRVLAESGGGAGSAISEEPVAEVSAEDTAAMRRGRNRRNRGISARSLESSHVVAVPGPAVHLHVHLVHVPLYSLLTPLTTTPPTPTHPYPEIKSEERAGQKGDPCSEEIQVVLGVDLG